MAELNGPIMYKAADVIEPVNGPSEFLLVITDFLDEKHGIPLTRGQAQVIADKLNVALEQR